MKTIIALLFMASSAQAGVLINGNQINPASAIHVATMTAQVVISSSSGFIQSSPFGLSWGSRFVGNGNLQYVADNQNWSWNVASSSVCAGIAIVYDAMSTNSALVLWVSAGVLSTVNIVSQTSSGYYTTVSSAGHPTISISPATPVEIVINNDQLTHGGEYSVTSLSTK